jgi:hypothetical protein
MLAEVAVQLAFPLLFSCIVYFLVGLQVRTFVHIYLLYLYKL